MRYPPSGYTPGNATQLVYNGTEAKALDPLAVDRASTWLACHKHNQPATIGRFIDNGATYSVSVYVPRFTEHIMIGLLCTGRGEVDITSGDDAWTVRLPVDGAGMVSGNADDCVAVTTAGPLTSPSTHNVNRDPEVDFDDLDRTVTFTFTVTDESGSQDLVVYAIKLVPQWPDEEQTLP